MIFTPLISPLNSHDTLQMTLNLHGLCLLASHASELSFKSDQVTYPLSFQNYVQNCLDSEQLVIIPFTDIFPSGSPDNMDSFSIQIWYPTHFSVEITQIETYNRVLGVSTTRGKKRSPTPTALASSTPLLMPSPTPTPTSTPTTRQSPTPTPSSSSINQWLIKSVSSMKETKDKVCGQDDPNFVNRWVTQAKALGVTHIAVETPYDSPPCGDSVSYTRLWVDTIHNNGLSVWHRHMPLAFEGIYNTPKNSQNDYLAQIVSYIRSNPTFFKSGDIFTPIPEPQNGGISGVTYCSYNLCIFNSTIHFNSWLREAMQRSSDAFNSIGQAGISIGYWGFDGFVAWGDNNPDWHGILEDTTVTAMGNITIDHYPEIVGDTMGNDLNELRARYPSTPIIIGEWGTISGTNLEAHVNDSMTAAKSTNVIGFNYWHLGMGGNEKLILDDFSLNIQYDDVQKIFSSP